VSGAFFDTTNGGERLFNHQMMLKNVAKTRNKRVLREKPISKSDKKTFCETLAIL